MNRREFLKASAITSIAELALERSAASPGTPTADSLSAGTSLVQPGAHLVWPYLVDPRQHPDYTRRQVQPPGWDVFHGQTQFAALRSLQIQGGRIVDFEALLDKYTKTYQLGDVLWLFRDVLFTSNLDELVESIQRRNLYLFDIWGYVPGSGPPGVWQQFQPPPHVLPTLESKLGTRWLGMDNGEQDGRYIGGYASEFYPGSSDRFDQYRNFHRHFQKLTSDLGDRLCTLVSLTFGHYFLKEGLYTLIGAETAQSLGNAQIYYSFIRGAGKQYGVLWFGNVSIYNRWGWKSYSYSDKNSGPTKGTSLSLMKRLIYSQILYNSALVAFEGSFFECSSGLAPGKACTEDELSPIGLIQQAARKWVIENGQPGPMLAPIALLLDFFAGWTFPRHLYSDNVFRVWGNLPYGPGDYLTDAVLQFLYPGYRDSSYFHNEFGFLTASPYGDAADCLLTDAPSWVMNQYSLIVVAGELQAGAELKDKLEAYLHIGGRLILTAANLASLPGGIASVESNGNRTSFAAGTQVIVPAGSIRESEEFELWGLRYPASAEIVAHVSGQAAAVRVPFGAGSLTVLASPFGVAPEKSSAAATTQIRSEIDRPLRSPCVLLKHVQSILDHAFRNQMLFEVGEGLSLITCRRDQGEYTLGIANQTWQQRPLRFISRCGNIESIHELPLEQSEKSKAGYLPEGLHADVGVSDRQSIAGGDIRIFRVRVAEKGVKPSPPIAPPPRPLRRALALRGVESLQEEVLRRPTFFEHYDSVVVDWRYLRRREQAGLERESRWFELQGLRLTVDFTSGINLYPNLRLIDNMPQSYAASMAAIRDVLGKMQFLPARDVIFALHRYPENNFSHEQTWQSFVETFRALNTLCSEQNIAMHLRVRLSTPPGNLDRAMQFLSDVGAPNLDLAPCTAVLLADKMDLAKASTLLADKVGMWLMNAPEKDVSGKIWNENAPIRNCADPRYVARLLAISPQSPLVFDAVYDDLDSEYLDSRFLSRLLAGSQET